MAEYQNIFTQVQVQGPPEMGMLPERGHWRDRTKNARLLLDSRLVRQRAARPDLSRHLRGRGRWPPGSLWFFLVGMSFWVQAGCNPAVFMRDLFCWRSSRRRRNTGSAVTSALRRRAGGSSPRFFLLVSVISWWIRTYVRAAQLGMGKHVAWAFASAIWLFLVLGLIRPILMGSWSEAVPYGIFPHLDWTNLFSLTYGNLFYNPFHALASSSSTAPPFSSRCTGPRSSRSPASAATGRSNRSWTVERRPNGRRLFWRWTMGFNATMEGIHRWAWWFAVSDALTGGIGILLTGTVVDNWFVWAQDHGYGAAVNWTPAPTPEDYVPYLPPSN